MREKRDNKKNQHSSVATELMKEFIVHLQAIPDGCAETFPFELIDELKVEYGV